MTPPHIPRLAEQIEALRKEAKRFVREFPERAAERRQRRALDAAEERKRTVLALLPEPNKPPALREWLADRTRFSNCLLGQALSGLIGEGRAERIHYPGGQSAYRRT